MSISNLRDSIVTFGEEVKNWRTRLDTLDIEGNPLVARYVNDQMMKLGKVEFYAYLSSVLDHSAFAPSKSNCVWFDLRVAQKVDGTSWFFLLKNQDNSLKVAVT